MNITLNSTNRTKSVYYCGSQAIRNSEKNNLGVDFDLRPAESHFSSACPPSWPRSASRGRSSWRISAPDRLQRDTKSPWKL